MQPPQAVPNDLPTPPQAHIHASSGRAAAAPPICRTPMPRRPWMGFGRSLLAGALSSLLQRLPGASRTPFAWHTQQPAAWEAAARARRRVLLGVVLGFAVLAAALLAVNAPASPSALWWAYAVLAVLLLAWVGAGTVTALMGAWVMLRGDAHGLRLADERAPIDTQARTAIIMPICNEDIATVFSGLRATAESLATTGALKLFDFYILSDSTDPAIRAAELAAWQRLRDLLGDGRPAADTAVAAREGARVFYRLRRRRTGRKAGNVADFCRRWGANYRYMIVLDADSTMHGDTLVKLVRLMEANPRAGIVQTLPQAYGHNTLHARAQQFATRVTGRLFALGMAYWQLGHSHYWGHNAILRVDAFMQHCGLAHIPGRGSLAGDILSHDFVEAACMGRAGYEVWLAPQLEGSWEQLPPNLIDELDRDRRWCRGNLQNAQLIAEPGWQRVHRAMFAIGALSYVMGPVWLVFVALGLWAGQEADMHNPHAGLALWALTLALLLLPRALGVAAVRLAGQQEAFGGTLRLMGSALLELALSALQAPVRMLAYSTYVLSTFTGLKLEWRSPPRDALAVGWRDAFSRLGILCTPLLLLAAWVLSSDVLTAPHIAPLTVALILAIPVAVWSSHPALGAALRRVRMLLVPDEWAMPRTLREAIAQRGFADLVPQAAPAAGAPTMAKPAAGPTGARAHGTAVRPAAWADRLADTLAQAWRSPALKLAALALVVALPHQAQTPDLPAEVRIAQQRHAEEVARLQAMASTFRVSYNESPRPRARPVRAARMIDDATRERAREAVRRAQDPVNNQVSRRARPLWADTAATSVRA